MSPVKQARIAAWCAIAAMFAFRISLNVADLDLYHQMALAREALRLGALPRTDAFAFTPTVTPVVHHEWGAGVIAHSLATALGGPGILLLKYALAIGAGLFAVLAALRRPGTQDAAWCLAPLAVLMVDYGYSPVRAQAHSFLFVAVTCWCMALDREGGRRWMLAYAPMFLLWANVHGGFVMGPALLLAEAVERALQRKRFVHLILFTAGLGLLGLVNPYGLQHYRYILHATSMPRPDVDEWRSLWAAQLLPIDHKVVFLLAMAIAIHAAIRHRAWRCAQGSAMLLVVAAATIRHSRVLPVFGLVFLATAPSWVAPTALGRAARRLAHQWPRRLAASAFAVAFGMSLLVVRQQPWILRVPNEPSPPRSLLAYPVGAVAFLKASGFHGNVLTPFEQGSYVSWKLYPAVKVSLDSRYEAAYPPELVNKLVRFYAIGADASSVLGDYGADLLLVPSTSGLARRSIPWRRVYADRGFALYARPGVVLEDRGAAVSLTDRFP